MLEILTFWGDDFSVSCDLASDAPYQWLRRKAEPCNGTISDCYTVLEDETLQTLMLIPVEFGDEGEYRCRGNSTDVSAKVTIVGEYSTLLC